MKSTKEKYEKRSRIEKVSLILGIVGFLTSFIVIGILPCIIGAIISLVELIKKKRSKKIIIGFIFSILGILCFFLLLNATSEEPKKKNMHSTEVKKEEKKENTKKQKEKDEFLNELEKKMDEKSAKKLNDILKNKIGFKNLKFNKKMEQTTNYIIEADGYDVVVTDTGNDFRIFIPNSDYVFYENKSVVMKASQFFEKVIDSSEQSSYYIIAKEIVKSGLKDPSSADFPSSLTGMGDVAMKKSGDIVVVQSYVDAKNSYGTKVRTKWTVEFKITDIDSFSYELIYINLGGKEKGKYIKIK